MDNELPKESGIYIDNTGNIWQSYGDGVFRLSNTSFMYSDEKYLSQFLPFRKLTAEK